MEADDWTSKDTEKFCCIPGTGLDQPSLGHQERLLVENTPERSLKPMQTQVSWRGAQRSSERIQQTEKHVQRPWASTSLRHFEDQGHSFEQK